MTERSWLIFYTGNPAAILVSATEKHSSFIQSMDFSFLVLFQIVLHVFLFVHVYIFTCVCLIWSFDCDYFTSPPKVSICFNVFSIFCGFLL